MLNLLHIFRRQSVWK